MERTKVLLVDDEVEFATALSQRLQLRKYDAKAVFCAEDALAVVHSNPPDVILLDLKMPGMSGFEVLRAVRQFNPTVEVIILSGHGSMQSRDEATESGIFDYVMKPIDIEELTQKIDSAKQRHAKG